MDCFKAVGSQILKPDLEMGSPDANIVKPQKPKPGPTEARWPA